MDAIDSFTDEAGDLMEKVYQHNAKVVSLGCTEGRKRSIR